MTSNNNIKHNRSKRTIAAMTMIELLAVLLIVTFGIAALLKFQSGSFHYFGLSKQRTEATHLAKAKIEALKAYETLATASGKVAYDDISSSSSTTTINNTSYTMTWSVTSNTSPDYKTINVTVTWTDRRNVSQSISLSSIISKTDPATSGVIVYG